MGEKMVINFTFNKNEQDTIRKVLKAKYIKQFARVNKCGANTSELNDVSYKALLISVIVFIILMFGELIFNYRFGFFGAVLYFSLFFVGIGVFVVAITSVEEFDRFSYLRLVMFIYLPRMKFILRIGVNSYMKNVERLLSKGEGVEIEISGEMGGVATALNRNQRFSIRTLYCNSVVSDVAFYYFTDSQVRKRCVIPVPVRYINAIDRAVS